jgi:hypothetical protein
MEATLEVKGVHEESMSAVRSAAPRGSDKATETALGNDLTVQLTCLLYPATNMISYWARLSLGLSRGAGPLI